MDSERGSDFPGVTRKDRDWGGQLGAARLNSKEKVVGERWVQNAETAGLSPAG